MIFITNLTSTTLSLHLLIGQLIQPIFVLYAEPTKNYTSMLLISNLMQVDLATLRKRYGLHKLAKLVGMLKVSILQVKMVHISMVSMCQRITDSLLQLMISVYLTSTDIHVSVLNTKLEVMQVIQSMSLEPSSLQMPKKSSPLVVMIRQSFNGDASDLYSLISVCWKLKMI